MLKTAPDAMGGCHPKSLRGRVALLWRNAPCGLPRPSVAAAWLVGSVSGVSPLSVMKVMQKS